MVIRITFAVLVLGASLSSAQTAEIASKEAPVVFKSTSNLVSVPVVVRDSKGHAIGNLGIADFQLFDNGKPQSISRFTLETLSTEKAATAAPVRQPPQETENTQKPRDAQADGIPDRFVAYLFDDIHIKTADLAYVREAAKRQIDKLYPSERTAIYTTSGAHMTDFTGDREKLHAALDALKIGKGTANKVAEQASCPPMTDYMADLIDNHGDEQALNVAVTDTVYCLHLKLPEDLQVATSMAKAAARRAAATGDSDSLTSLDALRLIVSKMATMPGQRAIVLVSPGFLVATDRLDEETRLIERAIKANVVIGALDARGLYTLIPGGDASEKVFSIATVTAKANYAKTESIEQAGIMDVLAAGTGGTFYKGTNDFDEGFARTAAVPEYLYILGFAPRDLKLNGAYHSLKVTLRNAKGMSVQVRKGYYAAKYSADPKEQVRQQLEETFFSLDEIRDLPAVLQTQYFKLNNGDATLSAVATIDVKKLAFRREGDRNANDVTVQTGLFDDDGNFVTGVEKVVTLRLLDETLQKRLAAGIGVKSSFTVHPGRYVVRMVAHDTQGQLMAAQSSVVEIP